MYKLIVFGLLDKVLPYLVHLDH